MSHARLVFRCFLLVVAISAGPLSYGADQQWIRVSSQHFTLLTDAGDKRGREILLRFEQMRATFAELLLKTRVNLSEPLEIIAFRSDKEYAQIVPAAKDGLSPAAGFFLAGEDRNYIVLNLSEDDSWRAVSYDFAHMLLNYNYPPTQSWFDIGFAEYFSSIRLDDRQLQVGGDPTLMIAPPQSASIAPRLNTASSTFAELLSAPTWIAIPDLFAGHYHASLAPNPAQLTLYQAESWIVMHYLINDNKLSETGSYFQLVEIEHMPVEQAIQKAYGMTAAQLEAAVREYFKSLKPQFEGQPPPSNATSTGVAVHASPSPIAAGNVGTSTKQVTEPQARALIAEMAARMPEHREQAIGQLQSVVADPKIDNAIAHRALAWIDMDKKEFEHAVEELGKAAELDANDPWVRYELALVKYHQARSSGDEFHGLANMMQDLRAVLDWKPDFAEAYHMLALARMEGGGNNSAMEAERTAMTLSPRNESYVLGMANIYIALKKWDAATATLEQLKTSSDPQIARAAHKTLGDLPTIKKYGIMPQETEVSNSQQHLARREARLEPESPQHAQDATAENPGANNAGADARQTAADRQPVQFAKGKIVSVDCSNAPEAVITVVSGARRMRFRTANYKALLLIGTDQFSCDWKNVAVAVNYKTGKTQGELVSLELQ